VSAALMSFTFEEKIAGIEMNFLLASCKPQTPIKKFKFFQPQKITKNCMTSVRAFAHSIQF